MTKKKFVAFYHTKFVFKKQSERNFFHPSKVLKKKKKDF